MTTNIQGAGRAAAVGDPADRALKAKHRELWTLGDYPVVASTVIPTLGADLVAAAGIGPGDRVLDIAAGSGNAAIPAARAGARVVAADLTPEMFGAGRAAAREAGVEVAWDTADAENLPYDDASFDVAISCVGVMFAPHHEAAAAEMLRILRPGGRLALIAWTPEGFVGAMLGVLEPYAAPPPPGAQPAPLWGRPDHVTELLGRHVGDLSFERREVKVDCFATGAAFRDFFRANYGPTVAVYARNAHDPEATRELDDGLAALGDSALRNSALGNSALRNSALGNSALGDSAAGDGASMGWEYLVTTAVRT